MSYIVIDGEDCEAVCPTGAVTIKDETDKAWEMLRADKDAVRVVFEIAPAVRIALGEKFGMARGENAMGKIAAALKKLGADAVADGAFGMDLFILREAAELSARMQSGENLPMFSALCPAWTHYAERKYPQLKANLSSCASPMQTFGEAIRAHFDALEDGRETKIIAVMPCAAEKCEETAEGACGADLVLTTDELAAMFASEDIKLRLLESELSDEPFRTYTGAGILAGVSGGMAEAMARRLGEDKSADGFAKISYSGVRGGKDVREAEIRLGERTVKIAVVCGLKAAGALAEKVLAGEAAYDFIEVTACPVGCVSGGGQPCPDEETAKLRAAGVYYADRRSEARSAECNARAMKIFDPAYAAEDSVSQTENAGEEENERTEEECVEAVEVAETMLESETFAEEELTAEEIGTEENCEAEERREEEENSEIAGVPEAEENGISPITMTVSDAKNIEETEDVEDEAPFEELFAEDTEEAEAAVESETESLSEPCEQSEKETEKPIEETMEETAAESENTESTADFAEEATETAENVGTEETDAAEETAFTEETEEEDSAEDLSEEDVAEPYHRMLSRKERRKLKRMKKFRH